MIISKTPYRLSLAGGLSDLENYYKHNDGFVISTTIDKYIYVMITKSHSDKFRVVYRDVETVSNINDIKHPIIRECLKYADIEEPLEIVSLADTVGGSGLGSSSAFTVGLLNALYTYKGITFNRSKLAEDACKIEIEILGEPIGKQDQYACTFGGLNKLIFNRKGVKISPVFTDIETYNKMQDNMLLFHTGMTRCAGSVLKDQKERYDDIYNDVSDLCWLAKCIYDDIIKDNLKDMGYYLNEVWKIKKSTGKVSNNIIDDIYNRGIKSGAKGGKICGAGSGGFILFYCEPDKQNDVRYALSDLKELPFNFEDEGTRIIYEDK